MFTGRRSHNRAEAHFEHKAEVIERSVVAEIERYRVALADVAAAVAVLDRIDAAGFANLTEPLTRHRLPGAAAVSLVVAAQTEEVPEVETRWRRLGDPALRLRPAGTSEHYFSVLSRPLDGRPPRLGIDAAVVPAARDVLLRARSTDQMAMSRAYRLLRDAALPAGEQQLSFVLAAPVDGPGRGWVVMALRGKDFLQEAIGLAAGDDADVTLSEFGTSVVTVADWRPDLVDTSLDGREVTITVPQRTWRLDIRPTVSLLPPTGVGLQPTAILIAVVLTGLLAIPVSMSWISRDRAARAVVRTTGSSCRGLRLALSSDAYAGLVAVLVLIVLLAVLTGAIAADRDRVQRAAAVVTAARRVHLRRQQLIDGLLLEAPAGLPAVVGSVALQLRVPLADMSAEAEALRTRAADLFSAEQRALLDAVQTGVRRIQELNEKLMDYAVADTVTLHPGHVDLTALAAEVAADRRALSTGPAPRIVVGDLPTVRGDGTLLRQVLDTLVKNAVRRAAPGRPAQVSIMAVPAGSSVYRIEVADDGIGVPPERRAQLIRTFDRDLDGRPYAVGFDVGLAVVRRIVQRHGGTIGADARSGGGSRFWFTLPRPAADDAGLR